MLGKLFATGLIGAVFASFVACGGGDMAVDCTTVTAKPYSDPGVTAAMTKCINCHSSTRTTVDARHGATAGYDYDTFDLAKQAAELGKSDVEGTGANVMPPIGQNCPKTSSTKCVVDKGGAVPALSATEKADFLAFTCDPKP